jgi:hypothetical protein
MSGQSPSEKLQRFDDNLRFLHVSSQGLQGAHCVECNSVAFYLRLSVIAQVTPRRLNAAGPASFSFCFFLEILLFEFYAFSFNSGKYFSGREEINSSR